MSKDTENLQQYVTVLAARACWNKGISDETMVEDVQSEALIALEEAKEMFQPDRGMKWRTYAHQHCSYRVSRYITQNKDSLIPMPDNRSREWERVKHARDALASQLLREPRDREWAAFCGIDIDTLHALRLEFEVVEFVPFADDVEDDFDYEQEYTAADISPSELPSPEEIVLEAERCERVALYVQGLTTEECALMTAMYGLDGGTPLSQAATAQAMGIRQQKVSELHVRALRKLAGRMPEDI